MISKEAAILVILSGAVYAQPHSFDVASVKVSQRNVGRDGDITTGPERFMGRNATLKGLIHEAWQTPFSRITGGAAWVSTQEYDVEAKVDHPVTQEELRRMLRSLLTDRFKLAVRSEQREARVYALLAGKDGAKVHSSVGEDRPGIWKFHGDLSQFADALALQLTIPVPTDPTTPSVARGTPIPVINRTGIDGIFDLALPMSLEPDIDPFTYWQRILQEQLGLRLESRKEPVDFLVIEHAERMPAEN